MCYKYPQRFWLIKLLLQGKWTLPCHLNGTDTWRCLHEMWFAWIRGPSKKLDLKINPLDLSGGKGGKDAESGKGGVSVETVILEDILLFHNLPLMILTCKSAHSSLFSQIRNSPYLEVTNGLMSIGLRMKGLSIYTHFIIKVHYILAL